MLLWLAFSPAISLANEWSGNVELEYRYFPHDPLDSVQHGSNASIAIEPQYNHGWDSGKYSFAFSPFARLDQNDEERSHFDVRELSWLGVYDNWELRLGVRKVFWGVTESQHLVDIINQTDLVENIDGEDKLGQPMINASMVTDKGIFDFFVLTGFRERTFPGKEGRLRAPLPVDTSQTMYESAQEEKRIDYAVRWYHSIDVWDIGLSHFYGTNRNPKFNVGSNSSGEPVLIPYYTIMMQTGLDLQATVEDWLWKLEWISRDDEGDRHTAVTAGFEYTFVGVFETQYDVGVLSEYSFDDRGIDEAAFYNHLMMGTRLSLNDVQSTALLAAIVVDLDKNSRMFNLEASRRIGENWKLTVESRILSNMHTDSLLYSARNDDMLHISLGWYF